MVSENQREHLHNAVRQASEKWKACFNAGDAAGCAAQYETEAVMHARPLGTFTGKEEIQIFWQEIIESGLSGIEYLDTQIEIIDEANAVLTANWQMNQASGVIHKEHWVLQPDGTAKLHEDDFEVQG